LHHVDVEPGLVRHIEYERPAVLYHRRRDDAIEQHFDGSLPVNAALFSQQHSFAEGEHLYGEAQVRRDLHGDRKSVTAYIGDFWPDGLENWLSPLEGLPPPSDHDGELTFFECTHAARHRRIEHLSSLSFHLVSQFAARGGAHRAHVDIDFSSAESRQDAICAARNSLQRLRVCDHRNRDLCCLSDGAGRVTRFHAGIQKPLRFRFGPIVTRNRVPRSQQALNHATAHNPQANKTKIRRTNLP
jgi:hypothetical protein